MSSHAGRLQPLSRRFTYVLDPLLEIQLVLRLHEWPSELAPIDQIAKVGAPILVIGGDKDHLTPAQETQELYRKALEPKMLWIVPGSGHADFLRTHPVEFERIVDGFFDKYLKRKYGGDPKMVPRAGLEPAIPYGRLILSQPRIPFRHPGKRK